MASNSTCNLVWEKGVIPADPRQPPNDNAAGLIGSRQAAKMALGGQTAPQNKSRAASTLPEGRNSVSKGGLRSIFSTATESFGGNIVPWRLVSARRPSDAVG